MAQCDVARDACGCPPWADRLTSGAGLESPNTSSPDQTPGLTTMSKEHKSDRVVDATEVALVTTGALVGGPAGAALGVLGVLANKMLLPLQHFRRAREIRFLERVSHFLEANDPEGAALFVAEHAVDEHFLDALDRGYEKMRRAFDPLAEECICVLVADHIRSASVTDRRFVRAGNLLEVSDKAILTALNQLCEAYLAAMKPGGTGTLGTVFVSQGVPSRRDPFFFVAMSHESKVLAVSNDFEAPTNFDRVLLLLANHGFGETSLPFSESAPEGRGEGDPSSIHVFRPADHVAMVSLHRYLAPVRGSTP